MTKKIGFFLVLFLLLLGQLCYADTKIGVVDMRRVFREADIAQKLAKDFYKDVQAKRKEFQAKEAELKNREKALKKKVKMLSKSEREKQLQKLKEETKQLKHMRLNIEDELRTKRQEIRTEIMKRVRKIISMYARKHNYAVIIPKGLLLYSRDVVDITDKIIKELNKNKK